MNCLQYDISKDKNRISSYKISPDYWWNTDIAEARKACYMAPRRTDRMNKKDYESAVSRKCDIE